MVAFTSPDSYRHFAQAVTHNTRYVHADEVRDFLLSSTAAAPERRRDQRLFPSWLLTTNVGEAFPVDKLEQAVWGEINHALSRPVTPDDPETEYVPT